MPHEYYLGVDVGTGSVRAALVSRTGAVVQVATRPIKTWNDQPDHFEQSSEDVWACCCAAVRVSSERRSWQGCSERNIVLWMDHRAASEAEFINGHKPEVLKYVGGTISVEMQTPKLMWLKRNLQDTWQKAKFFFDLPDYLTWRATGDDSRSLCSVVCKWTFVAGPNGHQGWDPEYFRLIGLEDLLEDSARKIGSAVNSPGAPCGRGLTARSASELGLKPGTPVGTSLIDAHAGGLGLLGCSAHGVSTSFQSRLSLICGTSTCHMSVTEEPLLVPGVWGPYHSAMVPSLWLNEAGQSATGKLVDHIIDTHPATADVKRQLAGQTHIYKYLNDRLAEMAAERGLQSPASLTSKTHVWPDFHGNRSPLADPNLLGMISGLTLSTGEDDLAVKYLATIQALAYGTKHILEALQRSGYSQLSSALLCGGLSKNPLFVQTHADVLGLPVLLPSEPESVLLGAAMLGAVAARGYASVEEAVRAMGGPAEVVQPDPENVRYHSKKYRVFLKMVQDQKSYQEMMTLE